MHQIVKPIQSNLTISSPMSSTTVVKTNFSIRSNASSTMTSNSSSNSYSIHNKRIGKILYGNCLSPITNSNDSLSIVKQEEEQNEEVSNEINKTNNKKNYFFRKFKSKRGADVNTKTQQISSTNAKKSINLTSSQNEQQKPKEKLKLHLSRESLIDKDLKRVLLSNEEDLIDLDLDTELDLTLSYPIGGVGGIPQAKTLPVISTIIKNETKSHNNNQHQHHGSNSTLNDSQYSFNEISAISSSLVSSPSPQPTTVTTCSPINTNENENDADIDDTSFVSASLNDWQHNNNKKNTNNVNTGKLNLNQLKMSNSKLKSKIYYDNLQSNFEYHDDIKANSGQLAKYLSDKSNKTNTVEFSNRSLTTTLSNYDNIATSGCQSNEFLSNTVNYLAHFKSTQPVSPTIISIPIQLESHDSTTINSNSTGKLSLNEDLKSISVTPSSIIFNHNSVTPSGSTTSSSNSSSSSYVGSTNDNTIINNNNSNNKISNNNSIYGCSCLACNCKYNRNQFSSEIYNDKRCNLTFNSLSIKQIILLKKYSLTKLNEQLHAYVSPMELSKIKLSSNYDKTSKFYSFRSFNSHNTTSNVSKEKRYLNNSYVINSSSNSNNNNNSSNSKMISNYRIFGLSLSTHYQRTGSPLPDVILNAMNIIESNSKDMIGVFRKPGVKTRIDEIHQLIDKYSTFKFLTNDDLSNENSFSTQVTYSIGDEYQNFNNTNNKIDLFDLADLIKQFFRELPECILTNNISQVILSIYQSKGKY